MKKWTDDELEKFKRLYNNPKTKKEIMAIMGIREAQYRYLVKRCGLGQKWHKNLWSDSDIGILKEHYMGVTYQSDLNLDFLAKKLKKHKTNICRKAKELGLTDGTRKILPRHKRKIRKPKYKTKKERSAAQSENTKTWLKNNEHPRGMKGKKHTQETKDKLRESTKRYYDNLTQEQKSEMTLRTLKTKSKKGTLYNKRKKQTWKAAWRTIGGIKKYYRSAWEANFARYLEFLRKSGDIKKWEHEPKTFWFENIKRGTRSYLPDFRVTENDNNIVYYEVKGWMDARSKTKLKRMKKYYPEIQLRLVDAKKYKRLQKEYSQSIEGWE